MTPAETLELRGVSWRQLERIAGKALRDSMHARRIHYLDEYRLDRAHFYFVELGLDWADRFDPELARGVSFTTSLYRHLLSRPPGAKLIDFLRREHGDERRGTPVHLVAAGERHELTDAACLDEETFERLIDHVGGGLTDRARQTLLTVAYDALVLGLERWRIAEARSIEPGLVSELLEELGHQLRGTVTA